MSTKLNAAGIPKWLIEALKPYDSTMFAKHDFKDWKWKAKRKLAAAIDEHTAKQVAAALEAVKTKVIGKNEIPQWDEESSFCDRCEFERTDDSKDCLCRIRNKLRAKQRIVLKTLQLAALTQGGHSE